MHFEGLKRVSSHGNRRMDEPTDIILYRVSIDTKEDQISNGVHLTVDLALFGLVPQHH